MADVRTEFLFEMTIDLDRDSVQELDATPRGTRRILLVTGGAFEGPALRGDILAGGGDWLLVRPDGVREVDVRMTLRTDDSHLVYVSYRGIIHGSPGVMQRMARGETVGASEYYFRTAPFFETGSEKYGWLNRLVAIGIGWRTPTGVAYTVHAVL
jgi:hypothetical protein